MKGICFKEPLFHKVVAGSKTQTRRIIVPQPDVRGLRTTNVPWEDWHGKERKPKYLPGETIYLKEPYLVWEPEHCESMAKRFAYKYGLDKATEDGRKYEFDHGYTTYYWHNKLFMPSMAARYFIKILEVEPQRLDDMTQEDARAEGTTGLAGFHNIWISIHGFSSLKENPWVWKYKFELILEL